MDLLHFIQHINIKLLINTVLLYGGSPNGRLNAIDSHSIKYKLNVKPPTELNSPEP